MNYSAINIQGNIISSEILEKIRTEDIRYQQAKDFGLDPGTSVRDEISLAWSLAVSHWNAFKQKREKLSVTDTGTTDTRNYWMKPLMGILGYDLSTATAEELHGKSYAISFRTTNRHDLPVHIVGINQSLDARAESGGPRLSPHALMQEYLNNQDQHLYGLVSNGKFLRLLRDATKLSRLSYVEFNLEQVMEESLFAEFALLYRLLHVSRMAAEKDGGKESIIEFYHLEALASGSRIRERLSLAVETSIKELANGFLRHNSNEALRETIAANSLAANDYYLYNLRIIYRLLFLMVIEERKLIYPAERNAEQDNQQKIYYQYYSIQRISKLAEKAIYVDPKKTDLWQSVITCFMLFEYSKYGKALGIAPLGSGLFAPDALGVMEQQLLDNETVLKVIGNLVMFYNENGQKVRVNYADLDVEEFGSVYEGLLEYEPSINNHTTEPYFLFKGEDGGTTQRRKDGAHYTPEELVKPLIKHSLDYLIADKLKEKDPEAGLLSLKVCDVACGSGHILLSAARRVGFELAKLRSKEDQPSPPVLRQAIRDVISHCIYGVDKNPLAVELCKVAMWLEAHNPGEPLNFLDHHIKCGDAIVGLAHKVELEKGIADEAFKTLPGDDKAVAASFSKRNKQERKQPTQAQLELEKTLNEENDAIIEKYNLFKNLPERTPEEVANKEKQYRQYEQDYHRIRMKQLADAQVAQFFIPKTDGNKPYLLTDSDYRKFLREVNKHLGVLQSPKLAKAEQEAMERKFFHWFLEFPEVFNVGGFDCVLGNPPFLGGQKLSGTFGDNFLEYLKFEFAPIGAVDLVTYFFRRIFSIINAGGFQSLISTSTISQGGAREGGLEVIQTTGGIINFAIRSMKWPGLAAVDISLISICKGNWNKEFILNNLIVKSISTYLDDNQMIGEPFCLKQNEGKSFQGSIVLGKGFVIEPGQAKEIIKKNPKNKDVLLPYLIGDDVNSNPNQLASRWVINFYDWELDYCRRNYPECYEIIERLVKPERTKMKGDRGAKYWWQFLRVRAELYKSISGTEKVMVKTKVSNTWAFEYVSNNQVFDQALIVIVSNGYSVLQSTIHHCWALTYKLTMKTDMQYVPTRLSNPFPFLSNLVRIKSGK